MNKNEEWIRLLVRGLVIMWNLLLGEEGSQNNSLSSTDIQNPGLNQTALHFSEQSALAGWLRQKNKKLSHRFSSERKIEFPVMDQVTSLPSGQALILNAMNQTKICIHVSTTNT